MKRTELITSGLVLGGPVVGPAATLSEWFEIDWPAGAVAYLKSVVWSFGCSAAVAIFNPYDGTYKVKTWLSFGKVASASPNRRQAVNFNDPSETDSTLNLEFVPSGRIDFDNIRLANNRFTLSVSNADAVADYEPAGFVYVTLEIRYN